MATDHLRVVHDTFADWNEHQDLDRLVELYYDAGVEFEVAFQGEGDDANFVTLHGADEVREFSPTSCCRSAMPATRSRSWWTSAVGTPLPYEGVAAHRGQHREVAPAFAYVISVRDERIVRVRDYPDRAEAGAPSGASRPSSEELVARPVQHEAVAQRLVQSSPSSSSCP